MTFAIIDITNFYVSAERVFDPKLRDIPLIVLSNNDACAISRSEEAKSLHISMGAPLFKIRDIVERHGVQVRSSNFELYADLNRRFNAVLGEFSPIVDVYSIDESFFELPTLPSGLGNVEKAHEIRERVMQVVGLPTRIGLGPTRTLSKVANGLAKASEKVWKGVIDLHDEELRNRLFKAWPVGEVWGIGKALEQKLQIVGVKTAADLAALQPAVARDIGTVVLERLVRELNGIVCHELEQEAPQTKGTAVTRQFGAPVTDVEALKEAMARRAWRAAEKIRHKGLIANRLICFAHGSRFHQSAASASRTARLSPATNDPREIIRLARLMVDSMFEPGGTYTKCGVLLEDLQGEGEAQLDMFSSPDPRTAGLLNAMDKLNARFGRGTMILAAQGFGDKASDTKRGHKSPSWTTDIRQVPVAY